MKEKGGQREGERERKLKKKERPEQERVTCAKMKRVVRNMHAESHACFGVNIRLAVIDC
jgi:hypothetical protein